MPIGLLSPDTLALTLEAPWPKLMEITTSSIKLAFVVRDSENLPIPPPNQHHVYSPLQ
jgi:hypothetical protein